MDNQKAITGGEIRWNRAYDTGVPLRGLTSEILAQDPLSDNLFVFVGKRRDRLKVLYFDGDGYALWYKPLECGTFRLPAADPDERHAFSG